MPSVLQRQTWVRAAQMQSQERDRTLCCFNLSTDRKLTLTSLIFKATVQQADSVSLMCVRGLWARSRRNTAGRELNQNVGEARGNHVPGKTLQKDWQHGRITMSSSEGPTSVLSLTAAQYFFTSACQRGFRSGKSKPTDAYVGKPFLPAWVCV